MLICRVSSHRTAPDSMDPNLSTPLSTPLASSPRKAFRIWITNYYGICMALYMVIIKGYLFALCFKV